MAHFAKVVNGKVVTVIVAEPEFFDTFVDSSPGEWIQTSYNTRGGVHYLPNSNTPSDDQSKALRKNYATIGGTYDKENDAFISPQPFSKWILNKTTFLWEPPVQHPQGDGLAYDWDDENGVWLVVPPPPNPPQGA